MNAKAEAALEAIKDTLNRKVETLSRTDYRDVLEELCGDIETRLDAVRSELAEDE